MNGIELSGDVVTINVTKLNKAVEEHNARRHQNLPQYDVNKDSWKDFLLFLERYQRDIYKSSESLSTVLRN